MKRRKALILTAPFGSGHVQAAKALAEQVTKRGYEPVISDLFEESYPSVTAIAQSLLSRSFSSYGGSFYKWFYYGTNKLNHKGLTQFSRYIGRKRLNELIYIHSPDFVITTFPFHVAPYVAKNTFSIPVFTVITDYCAHPYWINDLIDHYFVSTQYVKQTLQSYGIDKKKVTVSGIPIRSKFYNHSNSADLNLFGFDGTKRTITVFAGTEGLLPHTKQLCEILLSHLDINVIVICGRNVLLAENLAGLVTQFPLTFKLLRYVENIEEIFRFSTFVITKPGGLTLTELSATRTPVILYKPTPGQEDENATYFQKKNGALVSQTLVETIQCVRKLLASDKELNQMKEALDEIHVPNSAGLIVESIMGLCEKSQPYQLPLAQE